MSALLVVLLLAGAPDAGAADAPKQRPDVLKALSTFRKGGHEGITACAACHVTASWTDVRFNHERTGFPLTGKHARTSCKSCHVVDFQVPLTRGCVGCHRDVHAGELGARCESCHDTADWRSRFDADAHRRTNFPLFGAHAALPCVECHAEARERRFSRAMVDCAACHQAALLRTATSAVTHVGKPDFERACGRCHQPQRWTPARYFTHDACFPINAGPHAGIACLDCHDSLPPQVAGAMPCSLRTANLCVTCHVNGGSGLLGTTDEQHAGVQLYAPNQPRKCAECHKGAGSVAP